MRKIVLLALVLGILISPTAATRFDTDIPTSDLEEDFEASGDIITNIGDDGSLRIVVRYTLIFTNEDFNKTDVEFFEIQARDGEEALGSAKIGSFGLDPGQNRTGFMEFNVDKPALIDNLYFHTNHTALVRATGENLDRYTFSSFPYEPDLPEQKIENLRTNVTEVYRGEKIYLTGKHRHIKTLNISGHFMDLDAGNIEGWIEVPENIGAGQQKLSLDIRTGWGERFTRNLDLEVINRPPNITLNYPEKIGKGKELPLSVSAVDDMNVTTLAVKFQEQAYPSPNDFNLPTGDLGTGTYKFKAVAVDNDGARTERNASFRIVEENQNSGGGGTSASDEKQEEQQEDEEEEDQASGIPVIHQFRETIQSIISSIIGLF